MTTAHPAPDNWPGLSESDAAGRRQIFGFNDIQDQKRRGFWLVVKGVPTEPMFGLLTAASTIYLLIGDLAEGALLALFACVSIGLVVLQERRSERALAALRELGAPRAQVRRDGAWRSFLASTLAGSRRDPQLRAARQQIERIYAADGGTVPLPPMKLADEIAAMIAERSVDPSTGEMAVARPLQKQTAAVAGHVAREVLLMDRPVCADQLQGTVLLAERQFRVGGTFLGWRRRIAHWYAGFMAYKFDPNARPMSLQEAQELLRAENTRLQTKEDNKVMAHLGLAALLFSMFGGSVILMIVRGLSS